MKYSAVIVAAGKGSRMNLGFNKVYAKLEDERTILEHTMDIFLEDTDCVQIVVVTNPEEYRQKVMTRIPGKVLLAQGGETRQESVFNGLCGVMEEVVLVHDGARPYFGKEKLEELKTVMETEEAACVMVPCKDTIKRVKDGYIRETFERETLRAAQTPQAFRTDLLIDCIRKAFNDGYTGTDDCSLVEKYSDAQVKVLEGEYSNFKITTPEDLK